METREAYLFYEAGQAVAAAHLGLRLRRVSGNPADGPLDVIIPRDNPKAQMILWTLLLIVLFVSKSVLDGEIWDIPWALVALMGFSQAGFLAPKFTDAPSASSATPAVAAAEKSLSPITPRDVPVPPAVELAPAGAS